MKPTNHTVITKEGMKRKMDRMMAAELAKRFPEIYDALYDEILVTLKYDQANPFSTIVGRNKEYVSNREKEIRAMKRAQMEVAIKHGFHVADDMIVEV